MQPGRILYGRLTKMGGCFAADAVAVATDDDDDDTCSSRATYLTIVSSLI